MNLRFEVFLDIIGYLVNRMRKDSRLITTRYNEGRSTFLRVPTFSVFLNNIDCTEEELDYTLGILALFVNNHDSQKGIYYVKIDQEYAINMKTTRNAVLLQTLNDNLRIISKDKNDLIPGLLKVINDKTTARLIFQDNDIKTESKVDNIINLLFKENRTFPVINSSEGESYSSPSIANEQDDVKAYLVEKAKKEHMDRSKGGSSSHPANRKLEEITGKIVAKLCMIKTYNSKGDFYNAVCSELIKQSGELFHKYSAYEKYTAHDNDDWQRTIKTWCKKYIEASNISPQIEKPAAKNKTKYKH